MARQPFPPRPTRRAWPCAAPGCLGDRSILPWLVRQILTQALSVPSAAAFLELFPEARSNDELFSLEPDVLGPSFAVHVGDQIPLLPVGDRIEAWALKRKLLA